MKKFAIAAALVAASATAALAGGPKDAGEPGRKHAGFIQALDTSGDGKVDATEFAAGAAERAGKHFDAIDTEGKGVVTREQYVSAAGKSAEARFEKADRNGDGFLTKEDRQRRGGKDKASQPETDETPGTEPG
jgi:hypothetical protein